MHDFLIAGLAIGAVILVVLVWRKVVAPSLSASVAQLPEIVAQLAATGPDASFVVFLFAPDGAADEEPLNLQYSKENGRLGLDWVLLAPPNIRDKEKFADFVRAHGHLAQACEMNGVHYLRVEGERLDELGMAILMQVYRRGPDSEMDLIVEGFRWPVK